MKTVYAILAMLPLCIGAAIAGFDGGNAPGGQQVGGKWYNPNQGTGQGNPTGGSYKEGHTSDSVIHRGAGRVPQGGGTAPTTPTQVTPHSHQGCGCCCN